MAVFFDVSEILQFAIRIEENGEKFYRGVAEKTSDKELKDLFVFLADEEVGHKKIFTEMVGKITKYEPPETYTGEYFQYLKSYADNIIFPPEIEKELDSKAGVIKAIDFAIRRELDSIMYYLETKNLVPATQHQIMDRILEEERSHFIRLSGMKEKILKK
ncbi:MAG TPA: ferritin family protein [bacterium]|nr:ferritin family protein [bacterium]HPO91729.1 ferritin family protein [Victivallales bacterium]